MLSSITPLGERGRHNRFAVTAAAHIAGAVVGGAVGHHMAKVKAKKQAAAAAPK